MKKDLRMSNLQTYIRRYQWLVQRRAVPWKYAFLGGFAWGICSWMFFPVFNPIGAISSLQYAFGWFHLATNVVLGGLIGAVLIRLAGALLPYVAPLVSILVVSYLLALIGLIRAGQMVFVWSMVLATVIILIWWKYMLNTRSGDCYNCHGAGSVDLLSWDQVTSDRIPCGICGGSGRMTNMVLTLKLTPVFAIILLLIVGFGVSALNWKM